MTDQNTDATQHATELVRHQTHRAARCPWCAGPTIRDERLVDGYLRTMIVCLAEDTCGWLTELGAPLPVVEQEDR